MKVNKGDRVIVYGVGITSQSRTRLDENRNSGVVLEVDTGTKLGLGILVDIKGDKYWVAAQQLRLLKPKKLTMKDYPIGQRVKVGHEHFTWTCEHLDVYYVPSKPNEIRDKDKAELAAYLIASLEKSDVYGTVIGHGNDNCVRVELDLEVNGLDVHELEPRYIELEYIKKVKNKKIKEAA